MTDEEIQQFVQRAVDAVVTHEDARMIDVVDQLNTAFNAINDRFSDLVGLTAKSLNAMTGAIAARATRPPAPAPSLPPLGEVVVRLESGPTTRRIERDSGGNISRILEEPAR